MASELSELVRYNPDGYQGESFMIEWSDGEYVRYDQAVSVIAAKDAEFNKLEAAWLNAEGKITELEAELAKIKQQKPETKP